MSHTPRKPRRPSTAPSLPLVFGDGTDGTKLIVRPITGELRTTLDAMLSVETLLDQSISDAEYVELPPDLLAELDAELAPISLTVRVLARSLVATALDRSPPRPLPDIHPAGMGLDAAFDPQALDQLVQTLLPERLPHVVRPSRARREAALADASNILHEIGLEEFDVSCHLGTDRDGQQVLAAYPVPPESAYVSLLEPLFARAEVSAFSQGPLLAVERDAASWEFECWSAGSFGAHASQPADFAHLVREQEYSLADRVTMASDASIIGELANSEHFSELFPRQHRLAEALLASFTGVFECLTVGDNRATLRSLTDGRTYEVHEHSSPVLYAPGCIGFGRLLPFDGVLHLRSPGMVFVVEPEPGLGAAAADALAAVSALLPPALAIEGVISTFTRGVEVPRALSPAPSRTVAREMLEVLHEVLADADLEHDLSPDDVGEVLRAQAAEAAGARYVEMELDGTLGAYMAALSAQAGPGPGPRSTSARHTGKRPKKGKRKGKRRR